MTPNHDDSALRDRDAILLRRYAAGDPAAARLLTRSLAPRVYSHAARVLGNPAEAEDVTQEAMMRLWKIAPKWDGAQAQASTWLYRVTANLCTDKLRARRDTDAEIPDLPDPAPGPEARMQRVAREDALQDALAQLPARQRQAVVLRHLDGLGNAEIAEILEVGVEAVESLIARGKKALVAVLAGKREELGFEDD